MVFTHPFGVCQIICLFDHWNHISLYIGLNNLIITRRFFVSSTFIGTGNSSHNSFRKDFEITIVASLINVIELTSGSNSHITRLTFLNESLPLLSFKMVLCYWALTTKCFQMLKKERDSKNRAPTLDLERKNLILWDFFNT